MAHPSRMSLFFLGGGALLCALLAGILQTRKILTERPDSLRAVARSHSGIQPKENNGCPGIAGIFRALALVCGSDGGRVVRLKLAHLDLFDYLIDTSDGMLHGRGVFKRRRYAWSARYATSNHECTDLGTNGKLTIDQFRFKFDGPEWTPETIKINWEKIEPQVIYKHFLDSISPSHLQGGGRRLKFAFNVDAEGSLFLSTDIQAVIDGEEAECLFEFQQLEGTQWLNGQEEV